MLVQNENADTVVVFRSNDRVGFGAHMIRILRCVIDCQRRGYYFILDEHAFLPFRFTSVFKPFWDGRINQKMLEKARRIYVISHKLDARPYVVNDKRVVYDQFSWNIDNVIDNTQKNRPLITVDAKNIRSIVHQLNEDTQAQVCLLKQSLQLPKHYQAAHIRRGDSVQINFLGNKLCPPKIEKFLEKLNPDIKDVYIATDTLKVIKRIKAKDKNGHRFHSLIHENHYPHLAETGWAGFVRRLSFTFIKRSGKPNLQLKEIGQEKVAENLLYLLTDIDICRNAERFISSGSSSFSLYITSLRKIGNMERLEWRKCSCFEYLVHYLSIHHLYWSIRRIFS